MQYFELSLGNWRLLVHFPDNHLLRDTRMLEELVYCDELERSAQIIADGINPIAFEYTVLAKTMK